MPPADAVQVPLPAGGHLQMTLDLPGGPAAVVFVHGFGSDRRGEKARAVRTECARRRWNFAAFDFRGHGESSGTMPELRGSGLQADLEAVRLHLLGRGVGRLFLVGSSMGGWAASWYALAHPQSVAALALIAPAFRFLHTRWEGVDARAQDDWRQTGRLRFTNPWLDVELGYGLVGERDQFDPDALADRWQTPALIFHGVRDEVVPWRHTTDLVERTAFAAIEVRLLADGDHRLSAHAGQIAAEACRFFERRGYGQGGS
jgi:pimeloyl-ACP methyl ester carboxylesterase